MQDNASLHARVVKEGWFAKHQDHADEAAVAGAVRRGEGTAGQARRALRLRPAAECAGGYSRQGAQEPPVMFSLPFLRCITLAARAGVIHMNVENAHAGVKPKKPGCKHGLTLKTCRLYGSMKSRYTTSAPTIATVRTDSGRTRRMYRRRIR